ncbi:YtxH domain-containing protein [Daejeonella oryzae]|uniref:YtxH domain-containing protein n=1 Tax=Daejeonella oryzae TaxID=1122943 RepID=UPI0004798FE6|nr:YtxH domain-containing protein [Daejeonella oryzae]
MKKSSKILAAMGFVAFAGVIVGIMIAPDKGSRTIRKIKDKGRRIADDLEDTVRKGKEKLHDLREKADEFI